MTDTSVDFAALRAPFPAEQLGKLPRVTCKACSDSRQQCDRHERQRCDICKSFISTSHIHLDYVGHADVTSRLLEVDPEWTWSPQATDPDPELLKAAIASGNSDTVRFVIDNAPPKFETDAGGRVVGLWITLTVGGVTRLGYGSCPAGQFDAEKVLIGDALRNAAMRFGVAVDLWAKGDRADPTAENATASGGQAARRQQRNAARASRPQGQVSRPQRQEQPAQPSAEADPEAQKYADTASQARTVGEVEQIHKDAMAATKLSAFVKSPESGNLGKLALYLDWRRKQLADLDKAWKELDEARQAAGMDSVELEAFFRKFTDTDIESAGAGLLRQGAAKLRGSAAA